MKNQQKLTNPVKEMAGSNQQVTREMVYARTLELASLAGRNSHQFKQLDYERAKQELTGESDFDRQQEMLDQGGYK